MDTGHLQYPIGRFSRPVVFDHQLTESQVSDIASFPARMHAETAHLSGEQLDTPYRPGGWTLRQVVHHCADSHMNAFIRFRLALTEDQPTIKPYFEDRWARLADYAMPVAPSLALLAGLHEKWVVLLRSLTHEDLKRSFIHPEHGRAMPLEEALALYAWHGNHHLAHITTLKKAKGWV